MWQKVAKHAPDGTNGLILFLITRLLFSKLPVF